LFTSTALTLLVIPVLYAKFGKWLIPKSALSDLEATWAYKNAPPLEIIDRL
jgi:nickel/cobalt tolerance cation efflux system protein